MSKTILLQTFINSFGAKLTTLLFILFPKKLFCVISLCHQIHLLLMSFEDLERLCAWLLHFPDISMSTVHVQCRCIGIALSFLDINRPN